MMRWRRELWRVLAALLFLCMTVKLQLELRMLDYAGAGGGGGGLAPWWGNETFGHSRSFPKNSDSHNSSRMKRMLTLTESFNAVKLTPRNGTGLSEKNIPAKSNETQTVPLNSNHMLRIRNETLAVTHKNNENGAVNVISESSSSESKLSTKTKIHSNQFSKNTSRQRDTTKAVKKNLFAKLHLLKDGRVVNTGNTDAVVNVEPKISREPEPKAIAKPKDTKSVTPAKGTAKHVQRKPSAKNPRQKLSVARAAPRPSQRGALSLARHKGGVANKTSTKGAKTRGKTTVLQRGVSHDVDSKEVSLSNEEIARTRKQLEEENERQRVHNTHLYGPVLTNTTILLVQVHKRLVNLVHLVASMRAVRGINESLVIFSHDFWDEAMNSFVRNISEFRVLQVFFPFSIQLHPFTFPGRDPRDCPWNVNRKQALTCLNRAWPDSYGHFREAAFTQIKHHWWWKLHRVFEGLRVTGKDYKGHVVFLEEDHYLAPDLLHALHLMVRLQPALCSECLVLALGNYNKMNAGVYKNYVERGDWWVTKYNLGFALDAKAFWALRDCHQQFCNFDDYNWDWTMTNVVQTCHRPRIPMLSLRLSRVAHVGSCGTHVRKKSCDVRNEVEVAYNRFRAVEKYLFPKTLTLQSPYRSSGKQKRGNGGWGDLRDRQLCLAIANGTATESTIQRLQLPDATT